MNQLAENNAAEAAADTLAVEDTNSQFLGGGEEGSKIPLKSIFAFLQIGEI
jgi:hypothetical protein